MKSDIRNLIFSCPSSSSSVIASAPAFDRTAAALLVGCVHREADHQRAARDAADPLDPTFDPDSSVLPHLQWRPARATGTMEWVARAARTDSTLEPTEVASLVEQFREENELLDQLTDAGTVDIEAEHTTGDSAPGVTLEHIARSIENGRRIILLAWPDTAEAIARRLDEYPECMRSFSGEDGVHRLYNANGDIRAGPNEIRVYRPAGGQNKWLYHEATGEVELRANGETIATFADSEDVFADPTAYPATEEDSSDFSEWTTIKRPALPSRIERNMVDVIAVTDDGLEVLEPSGSRTPITELLMESDDEKAMNSEISVDDLRR